MSYRPLKKWGVTAQKSGRFVDGVATYVSVASFVSGAGGQDSASIGSTMSQMIRARGGALRSNGDFTTIPGNMVVNSATGRFDGFARELGGNRVVRSFAGTSWTGAGNVLSDVAILIEFIP